MYCIFDRENGKYTLPNGVEVTSNDLRNNKEYSIFFEKTCVLKILDSVLVGYSTLSEFANKYGVDYTSDSEDDPQTILDEALSRRQYLVEHPTPTISDTILKAASFAALSFTDEQALEVPDLYPVYEVDHAYKKDERFAYNGRLFKVNQAHTSAAQWVPGETGTESLYTCLEMAGDGYLVWTQPTGAHNAYNTGDIVHYPTADDPLYKSLIDGNTWSPDAYPQGWEIYTAE